MESLDNCSVVSEESYLSIEEGCKPKIQDYDYILYDYIGKIIEAGNSPTGEDFENAVKERQKIFSKDLKNYISLVYYHKNRKRLNKYRSEKRRQKRQAEKLLTVEE